MNRKTKSCCIKAAISLVIVALIGCKTSTLPRNVKQDIKTDVTGYYFTGLKQGNVTMLRKAFHPDARLTTVKDGQKAEETLDAYLQHVIQQGPVKCTTKILELDITGRIAHAKTKFDYGEKVYIDYLSLIHTKEGWKIINKTYFQTR